MPVNWGEFTPVDPTARPEAKPGQVDWSSFEAVKPEKPRGAATEIGSQLWAGASIDLPKMVGQSIRWIGGNDPVANYGADLQEWAQAREKAHPELAPQPESHGLITNTLAMGARAMVPSLAAGAAAIPAAVLAPELAVPAAATAAAGFFGASQAQETHDKVLESGGTPDEARTAGYISGLIEGGGEAIGTMAGMKLLGIGGSTLNRFIGGARKDGVQGAINATTDSTIWKPFGKALGTAAVIEPGTEFGQNYGEAKVEQAYGVKSAETPLQSGLQGAQAALGMTALLAPFGLAGHTMRARSNQRLADALQNPDTPLPERVAAAFVVHDAIKKENPEAADWWAQNSAVAIASKSPIHLEDTFATSAPAVELAQKSAQRTADAIAEISNAHNVDDAIAAAATAIDDHHLPGGLFDEVHGQETRRVETERAYQEQERQRQAEITAMDAQRQRESESALHREQQDTLTAHMATARAAGMEDTQDPNAMRVAFLAALEKKREGGVSTPAEVAPIAVAPSEVAGPEWRAFAPASGTLNIPRADMPQVKAEHRGAMVNFLNARGISHQQEELPANSLKPTQAEYSPAKVRQAQEFKGGDRSILVSSDNHIVDGHHQALAKLATGEPIQAIRLNAPVKDLLPLMHEFPSSYAADGATQSKPDSATPERMAAAKTQLNVALRGKKPWDVDWKTWGIAHDRYIRALAGATAANEPGESEAGIRQGHLDHIETALEEGKTVPAGAFVGHHAIDATEYPLAAKAVQSGAPAAAPAVTPAPAAPEAAKPITILGRTVDKMTPKELQLASKKARTAAQREAATVELSRRDEARNSKPLTEAQLAARAKLKKMAEQRKKIDTNADSIIPAIIKLGGLDAGTRLDITGDKKGNRMVPFVGHLFRAGGRGLDDLATSLGQYGYLSPQELADVDGGVQALRDKIRAEFDGTEQHWAGNKAEAEFQKVRDAQQAEHEFAAQVNQVADERGINEPEFLDAIVAPEDLMADGIDVTPANLVDADLAAKAAELDQDGFERLAIQYADSSDAEFESALKEFIDGHQRQHAQDHQTGQAAGSGEAIAEAGQADTAAGEAQVNGTGQNESLATADPAAEDAAGGVLDTGATDAVKDRPALALESHTEKDVAAKDARAADESVANRAQADRERDHFTLSAPEGSAAAPALGPQNDMFGARGLSEQPANPMAAAATALRSAADAIEKAVAPKTKSATPAPQLSNAPSKEDAAAPAAAGAIEDFGKKITGAHKDYAASFKQRMAEAVDVDIAAEPLSKSWPEPDYQKLLEGGANPWTVAFMHAARDEIPTKPTRSWRLAKWVEQVKSLREFSLGLTSGRMDADFVRGVLEKNAFLSPVRDRIELYEAVGHDKSLKGIRVSEGSYSVYAGKSYSPPKVIWSVEGKTKTTLMSRWPTVIASGDTKAEAIAAFKEKWSATTADKSEKTVEFDVYGRQGINGFFIGKKIGKKIVELKGGFATAKDARAWKNDNQAELVKALERFKDVPAERRESNSPRVGDDHRNGANVTPEQFKETFGFRGGQFGNTMPQGERQSNLNEAYDALMDLAGVIGISPKALSLNGELGLAFGARGRGGKHAPAAHYEADVNGTVTDNRVVINLTRARGAGSLAHEWFHAVDNYFARMGGHKAGFLTERFHQPVDGVRPEMITAFQHVMAAIQKSEMPQRSEKLDDTRTTPYWATRLELAARAFESYVIAKLQDQSASNDYLANIVSPEFWEAATALGMEKEGTYPYVTPAEIPAIRAAFDEFFNTIQTRETPTGTAMFSRASAINELKRGTTAKGVSLWHNNDVAFEKKGGDDPYKGVVLRHSSIINLDQLRAMKDGTNETERTPVIGKLTLGLDPQTDVIVALFDIDIHEDLQRGGEKFGERVVRAVLAGLPEGGILQIKSILPEAAGFWSKMGVRPLDTGSPMGHPDGYLTRANYEKARGKDSTSATTTGDNARFRRDSTAGERAATDNGGGPAGRAGYRQSDGSETALSDPASETAPPSAGLSVSGLRDGLAAEFGERTAKRLIDTGIITPLADQSKLPDNVVPFVREGDKIFGFYDPVTDKTYAVLSNLNRDMLRGLVLHEVGTHYGFDRMLGPAKYKQVMKRLDLMHTSGNAAVREARAIATKESIDKSHIAEETLAYLVQNHPRLGIVREIIAAIKAFLFREFGIGGNALSEADITALAKAAVEHSAKEPVLNSWQNQFAFSRADQNSTKVVDDSGKPLTVYQGSKEAINGDFKSTVNGESGRGIYFAADPDRAAIYAYKGDSSGPVTPVTVNIQNPASDADVAAVREDVSYQRIKDNAARGAEMQRRLIAHGFDGVIVRDGNDAIYEVVAFKPEQIQSAIGNNSRASFSRAGAEATAESATVESASPTERVPAWAAGFTKAQQDALRKSGVIFPDQTIKERAKALTKDFGKKFVQGVLDQFAPLRELDQTAYMKARLSKATDGGVEALLLYGKPFLRDGALDVDAKDAGFLKTLQGLKNEHDRFFAWVAGQRARELKAAGKENLLTDEDLSFLTTLNRSDDSWKGREGAYLSALKDLRTYNKSVMDIAEQQGIIDGESRPLWESQFYVPFYRAMEDGVTGPTMKSGLVRQYAFKKLKGGTENLNDLLKNTLMNWSHLLSAAQKNAAAKASILAAVKADIATEVPEGTKDAVWFLDNGTKRTFLINDPYVMDAISAIEQANFGPWMKPLSAVKRWLTLGVTANPAFKIRNLIRDSIAAIGQNDISYNVWNNVVDGWKSTAEGSQTRASLMAGGGMFRFGTMLEGDRAQHLKRLVESGVDEGTVLDTKEKVKAFFTKAWDSYQEFGDRSENINRAALYDQLVAAGNDHLTASFLARDMLDFGMSGKWAAVRFLTQVVPFMNARLQGLYKLGRGVKENPVRAGYVTGAIALASLALLMGYGDDDDWKKREDWDRDTYWWFKFGGVAFRIPKPFELGAIGTIAERTYELAFDKEMSGKRFTQRMADIVSQNFSMSPVPQLVKPLVDLYANQDSFSGRQIETMGMEKLRKQDRYTASTTYAARLVGQLGIPDPLQLMQGRYEGISPAQADYLIRGYFGWLGTTVATATDYGIRPLAGAPVKASMQLRDVFLAGNFAETVPSNQSRYVTDLYEQAKEIEQAYSSYHQALKQGDHQKAREIFEAERANIIKYKSVEAVKREESKINARVHQIENSDAPAETKRRLLDMLAAQKDKIARHITANP